MIIVAGTVEFDPAQREAALAAASALFAETRAQPGCLDYVWCADPSSASRVYVYERWRDRFVSLSRRLGAAEEVRGAWADAADVYRRAIEAEPMAEALYQRLMICCLERGLPAEAFTAYQRCRDTLSAKLGLRPSPQTEALRQRIAEQSIRSA